MYSRLEWCNNSRVAQPPPLLCSSRIITIRLSALYGRGAFYRSVMPPVLGYWDIRGLGGALRCILHYTDTEFEDKRYAFGIPPNLYGDEWPSVKYTLGLDFPTLPYYIDGDVKMNQSIAILRYLGRKNGLTPGNTEEDLRREDMVCQQIMDTFVGFALMCYHEKFDTQKDVYTKELPDKLALFCKFLGTKPWLMGEKLTYVDFMFHELLESLKFFAPDVVSSFDNFRDFMQRFEALPNVQKYRKSKQFTNWPLFAPLAKFGGSGEPPVV